MGLHSKAHSQLSVITDEISQDFNRALDVAKDYGIDAVEVRAVWKQNIALLGNEELDRMKAALTQHNMKVSVICSPFGKCYLPGSRLATKQGKSLSRNPTYNLEFFDHLCEVAHFFGTRYIRIFAFIRDTINPKQNTWDRIVSTLKPYVERAEEQKVILLIENEHICFTDTISHTLQLFEEINSPAFKLNLDPGNFWNVHEATTPEAYEVFYQKGMVAHMHIKDPLVHFPFLGAIFGVVGKGHIDYPALISQAKSYNYSGYYTLETHSGFNKEKISRESLKNLQKWLA